MASIKAAVGLWTNQYLSALGLNSAGTGGGSISTLDDVVLTNPSNGQVLKYDNGRWVNANESGGGGGGGTVTSITAGTGLDGGTINVSGTIAIDSTYLSYISHGESAYNALTNYYTKTEADAKFMTIAAFENLFAALDANGDPVSHPYASGVASIKAAVGLWTNQYLSALGLNSSGTGGGSLATLDDVLLSSPQNGQVLMYDGTRWVNQAVNLSAYATQTWVQQQGYLTSVTFSDLTSHPTTLAGYGITDALSSSTTFWGQTANNGAVKGTIEAGNSGGQINGFHGIELNSHGSLSNYGGYIDFHHSGYSSDFTLRLIEGTVGVLSIESSIPQSTSHVAGLVVGSGNNGSYIQIGDIRIVYDNAATNGNNALKIIKADGTAANLYATGGISSLGFQGNDNDGSIGTLTVTDELIIGNGKRISCEEDMYIGSPTSEGWVFMADMCGQEEDANHNPYWTIMATGQASFTQVKANRFYLDGTRYIYLDTTTTPGTTILKYYDGTTAKTIQLS